MFFVLQTVNFEKNSNFFIFYEFLHKKTSEKQRLVRNAGHRAQVTGHRAGSDRSALINEIPKENTSKTYRIIKNIILKVFHPSMTVLNAKN